LGGGGEAGRGGAGSSGGGEEAGGGGAESPGGGEEAGGGGAGSWGGGEGEEVSGGVGSFVGDFSLKQTHTLPASSPTAGEASSGPKMLSKSAMEGFAVEPSASIGISVEDKMSTKHIHASGSTI